MTSEKPHRFHTDPPVTDESVTKRVVKPSVAPTVRDRAYLVVLHGANLGQMYRLTKNELVLGRGTQSGVRVEDDGISRRHARFFLDHEDEFCVQDLGSSNGTFVNGEEIKKSVRLKNGDKIRVGSKTVLRFSMHDTVDENFHETMRDAALRDPMTRIYNRAYLFERLDTEWAYAIRHKVPLSLVMLDIDHFKRVNDTWGHVAGDGVIIEVVRRIQSGLRAEDILARYGGEEFAVLCRGTGLTGAEQLGERLRKRLAEGLVETGAVKLSITASFGVGALEQEEQDVEHLLRSGSHHAHEQAAGRNRVKTATK